MLAFHPFFHSLKLCCEEVETIVQVAFCGHLLQVRVAVLVLVRQVIGHQKSWKNENRERKKENWTTLKTFPTPQNNGSQR